MAYITNEDIERRVGTAAYVQLADDDGDGVADAGVVDEVRLGAEGELNSFLARRYQTPISIAEHPELSGLLMSLALDLAEYRLRLRRPPVAEHVRSRQVQSIELLERIATGVIQLPSLGGVASDATAELTARALGAERLLSRDELAAT